MALEPLPLIGLTLSILLRVRHIFDIPASAAPWKGAH